MHKHYADSGPGRRTSMAQDETTGLSFVPNDHLTDSGGHLRAAAVAVTSIAAAALALGPS